MDNWVIRVAEKERQRRARIRSQEEAYDPFLQWLMGRISEDVRVFTGEFPENAGKISVDTDNRVITREFSASLVSTLTISFDPRRSVLQCEYAGVNPARDEHLIQLSPDGRSGMSGNTTIDALPKAILMPFLFPELSREPSPRHGP